MRNALAEELALTGTKQERLEAWIKARVQSGASTRGLYPPIEPMLAEYRATLS
jgi:hypothetical protein